MALKEKDIVNHLCENWETYFPELKGCKKEYSFRDSRVDILSSIPVDLYEEGIREEDDPFRYTNAAVFVEVKFNSEMRDLLFELKKHIDFRNWYIEYGKSLCYIVVISDKFEPNMVKFMEENDITMFKYTIENEDLNTLKIEEYETVKS